MSKHEQFVDLKEPSLEGLSFLLRHKDHWPSYFEWGYAHPCTCAYGLMREVWGLAYRHEATYEMCRRLSISNEDAMEIYARVGTKNGVRQGQVTPEMVADEIDEIRMRKME